MVDSGFLILKDKHRNRIKIELSEMQLLSVIRILGLMDTTGEVADNDITGYDDKSLLKINCQILDEHKEIFGNVNYLPMKSND